MYIIFGIITTLAAIFMELLFLQFGFSLHDFRPGLVIPAGGLMDGAICALGIYLYIKVRHYHLKPRYFLGGVILSILGFLGIYYMTYLSAYVDNGIINHSFKGLHISNYMFNDTKPFTFGNYLFFLFKNYTVTTYSPAGMVLARDNLGAGFHTFAFIMEGIGFCLGGIGCAVIAIQGREYCKKCKSDFIKKHLYAFSHECLEAEITGIQKSFDSKEIFREFIKKERGFLRDGNPYIDVYLKYCISCKTSYIEYRFMYPLSKNSNVVWKENRDNCRQISIPYQLI